MRPLNAFTFVAMLGASSMAGGSADDPTSGDIVMFPGELPLDNYASSPSGEAFTGYNIPGKPFDRVLDGGYLHAKVAAH